MKNSIVVQCAWGIIVRRILTTYMFWTEDYSSIGSVICWSSNFIDHQYTVWKYWTPHDNYFLITRKDPVITMSFIFYTTPFVFHTQQT